MSTSILKWSMHLLFAGVMLPVLPARADDFEGIVRLGRDSDTGIVRVSDSRLVIRAQSPESEINPIDAVNFSQEIPELPPGSTPAIQQVCRDCPQNAAMPAQCPESYAEVCEPGVYLRMKAAIHNDLARKGAWFRGHFGDGGHHGGRGYGGHHEHGPERPLAGAYHIVYPVDPGYFDARDGQIYAAAGYGGPVSVPLAPVVNHTYNYGWGIPSSRLTPVLHPVTQAPVAIVPGQIPSAPISY